MIFSESAYESLLEEIAKVHPTVQTSGFNVDTFKPGLDGMRRFDASIGSPSAKFRSIHVAGTNGKGSVCSMLAAALASCGLKVGLYTSPHLVDFRERIKIIDASKPAAMIPKSEVFDFLTAGELSGLSYFEITTGMAFWWFAKEKVDLAVIEVGLGGRLDSTNIITPELTVITGIGLDHCAILGGTRAVIACEKAGIFKPGVPSVVWGRDEETDPVFEKIAADTGSPLHYADKTDIGLPDEEFEDLLSGLDLQGPCQRINLRTVLAGLTILGKNPTFHLEEDAFRRQIAGITRTAAMTAFRGRWERLQARPEVICDIGHNPPALKVNFARLMEMRRPLIMVYGIMADKDLYGIAPLMPAAEQYILAAPDTSRSLPAEELRDRLAELRPDLRLAVAPSVAASVKNAIKLAAGIEDALVYVGGSTFVVAEAIMYLESTDSEESL